MMDQLIQSPTILADDGGLYRHSQASGFNSSITVPPEFALFTPESTFLAAKTSFENIPLDLTRISAITYFGSPWNAEYSYVNPTCITRIDPIID